MIGNDILCRVISGGELRSRNRLNLPGINLGISAFTEHDRECLKSAQMLAIIAKNTEPYRYVAHSIKPLVDSKDRSIVDIISHNVHYTVDYLKPRALFVPTHRGNTPRMISRFMLSTWIVAVTHEKDVFQNMQFSYGVFPVIVDEHPQD